MPLPDVSCMVLTVGGQWKRNESWVIGRLLRDLELTNKRADPGGMRIDFLRTCPGADRPNRDRIWWSFCFFFAAQFGVAVLSLVIHGKGNENWSIILITTAGTGLAFATGSLPQWGEEKYTGRRVKKDTTYILTRGDGHSHVFVINVDAGHDFKNLDDMVTRRSTDSALSRIATVILAFLWIILLITVGGPEQDTWFLLGVGLIGMIHNVIVVGWKREPEAHRLPLDRDHRFDLVDRRNVYEVLLDAEFSRLEGVGKALLRLSSPAGLKPKQDEQWTGLEKQKPRVSGAEKPRVSEE